MLSGRVHIWVADFVAAEKVRRRLIPEGVQVQIISGQESVVVTGESLPPGLDVDALRRIPGVRDVAWTKPAAASARHVRVGSVTFGAWDPVLIAGPCAVESAEQLDTIARAVKESGARMLRGGAFKPRTHPTSFQGLGEAGLQLLQAAGNRYDLPVVSEVPSPDQVPLYAGYLDMLQIGSRHMQNTPLLRAAGKSGKPVLLKRSATATLDEWIAAADYIRDAGNEQIVLCERGIRTFSADTRYTLDLSAFFVVAEQTGCPVIADPSHAAGNSRWVEPLARAALAAGAAGLLIEVHHDPAAALSDGAQSLTPEVFEHLVAALGLAPAREAVL
jgi:3-deoxy-7-phosphoheptulonate synthase